MVFWYCSSFNYQLLLNLFSTGLEIVQVWSINHTLRFSPNRYTNIVFIGLHMALTYIERLILIVCYLFSYFSLSLNCRSCVFKLPAIFMACSETAAILIFESLQYCHIWKVQFQFFCLVCKLFKADIANHISYFGHFQICGQSLYCRVYLTQSYIEQLI